MLPESESAPAVGGALARRLARLREDIVSRRRATLKERSAQPTVAEFYAGRSVLLTGGSGFLGRLIIEMLLRTCPDIGKVYLIVRAKRGIAPQDRLDRLFDVPLFDRVRAEQPGALGKLAVLPGDITLLGLGLSEEHRQLLQREVSVVFHLAASVRFDDPFQKAVFTNLRSTREVVELSKGMQQLRVLVHVSTAYTNINRNPIEECVYPPHMDWREVIRWAEEGNDQTVFDFLGPKLLGFQANTYTFTKALAEQLIEDMSDELPVIITRPSIVCGTFTDPFPGWLDNLYGLGGFWAGACKGVMRVAYDPKDDVHFDTVPGDMAAKSLILASRHRGCYSSTRLKRSAGGAEVVNVAVGLHNGGVSFGDMVWCLTAEGVRDDVPFPGIVRTPKFTLVQNRLWHAILFMYHHVLFGFVVDLASRLAGIKPRLLGIYRQVSVALNATSRFRENLDFIIDNQKTLQASMHPDDEENYCSLACTHARDTLEDFKQTLNDAIRGILKFILKEEDNPAKNMRTRRRLEWVMAVYHSLFALLVFFVCTCLIKLFLNNRNTVF